MSTRPATSRVVAALLIAAFLAAVLLAGCSAAPDGPTVLVIEPDQYAEAFEAVLAASDKHGFEPMLRDRRRGIIETRPVVSPSMFEPWKTGPYSSEQIAANTANLQRRRLRWEFAPRDIPIAPDNGESGTRDLLELRHNPVDLTNTDLAIELRVAVFIERAHSPGTRPSVWTTSDATQAVVIDPETGSPVERSFWTPIARDERYERLLLAALQQQLASPSEPAANDQAAADR